jgi:DNA-binding HxlR family transcriptional regulator
MKDDLPSWSKSNVMVATAQEYTKKCNTNILVTIKKSQQISTHESSTGELEEALKVLEGRWKILILFHLFSTPVLRFSELRRLIPGISQKMLIQQLRDLEKDGVVNRKVSPEVPPKVEYMLTKNGVALRPALRALKCWAVSRKACLRKKKRSADSV